MAENSLFAQRLHAITERRRLHERILATRRALEEERLRAQRLKRTSLRERWLMEGTPMPAEDQDRRPSLSPLGEAEERVRDLEQDLSSLQSQMQDLDNMDLPQQQQPQSLKEVMPLDGLVKIDGTSSNSPQKGNPTETKLELASDGPQKPTEPAAKEQLENGDMSEEAGQGLPFGVPGNECSSGKTEVKVNPVAVEGGDSQPRPGKTEGANSATKNLDLNEAPAAYQRKLAVEKMVIRDHLGQEVGSMDAVGQTQAFIRKEDELEDHENLGNDCEEGGPCNVVDQKEAENHLDCDLGSRDGPDGASPTSHDQPDPPNLRQDSANCLDPPGKQGGSEQERGPLAEEAVPMETGPNERPERNAEEEEEAGPARNQAVCDAAAEEAAGNQANHAQKEELQGCRGSEPMMLGGAEEGEETRPSVSGQIVLDQEATLLNPLEEARTDPAMTSSDQIPSPSDGKASLPGHNPLPFQETETRFLESEESLLPDQSPSVLLDQSLQEIKDPPLGRSPSSLPESCIASNPPSVQDRFSSPEQKPPSLQDEIPPPEAKGVLSNQTPSSAPETPGKNLDPISTALQEGSDAAGDQLLPSSPDQLPALPGEAPSSSHEGQRSPHILPAALDQEPPALETKDPLPDRPPSVTNPLSPLSDQIVRLEDAGPSSSQEVQLPTVTETQNPLFSAGEKCPAGQIPFPENEKEETPTTGPDQNPLALLDQKPPFLDGEEATGPRTDHSPLRHPNPSCLPEGSLQDQAQPTAVEHVLVSLQDQTSSLEGTEETLPGKTSPFLVDKTPTPLAQTPTPNEDQGPMLQQTTVLNALPTANQESAQPLLEVDVNSENREPKEDRDATLASEAEAAEIQESMAAEQQPLLDGLKATVATQDIALGHPQQPKSGAPKHQGASIQEAPVYITTDGHPASGHLQPTGSHQEEGQEEGQSRRKQKTCQCCLVM